MGIGGSGTILTGGAPYEVGRQYGEQTAAHVRRALAAYSRMLAERSSRPWAQAVTWARRYDGCIGDLAPRSRDEMRGMADGAGVDYGDILALNCRSELMYVADEGPGAPHECSSFALVDRPPELGVVAGQNWDWNPLLADATVVHGAVPDDEPSYLTAGEAGHLAKASVNSEGLGVFTNTLVSWEDDDRIGLPYHVVLRELVRRPTTAEATTFLRAIPRTMSANYLIVDRTGDAVDFETTGGDRQALSPLRAEASCLSHTNHFLDPSLAPGDRRVAANPHTRTRLCTLQEGLGATSVAVDCFRVLRDHSGFPNSVCSHPSDEAAMADRRATLASIVAELSVGLAWIRMGRPCEGAYRAFGIQEGSITRRPDRDERSGRPVADTAGALGFG